MKYLRLFFIPLAAFFLFAIGKTVLSVDSEAAISEKLEAHESALREALSLTYPWQDSRKNRSLLTESLIQQYFYNLPYFLILEKKLPKSQRKIKVFSRMCSDFA